MSARSRGSRAVGGLIRMSLRGLIGLRDNKLIQQ